MASNFAAGNIYALGLVTLVFLVALLSSTSVEATPDLRARSGEVLQVLVPDLSSDLKEFVECSNDVVKGFCIDVFKSALDMLIPRPTWTHVNYTCFPFTGDATYNTMVNALSNQSYPTYDAVVGDVTISASRLGIANFTQSYLDSGIVIVTLAEGVSQKFPGVFFVPFTIHTWLIMIVSIALAGIALWLLECNVNPLIQGTQSKSDHLKKVFWFVTSILVFFKRESIKNPLSKFVMIAWILFILLLGSGYTANLSSILTVNDLSPVLSLSIDDLSKRKLLVGYQEGSIVQDYLTLRHNITNLVPLKEINEYADALHSKMVAVIVDEIPYISSFLVDQSTSNCKFAVSSKLTNEGFGFAFYDKTLSTAFSIAILNLSESGRMQKLQDGWKVRNFQCPSQVQSIQLDLKSSEGLFILLGSTMLVGIVIFVLKHLVFPCLVQNYERMWVTPRQDAINDFWEPNFHGSIRRWFSNRHHMSHEVFA